MNLTLVAAISWVFLGTILAFLPISVQKMVGWPLLLAAPVLIWLMYREFGPFAAGFALFAFLSMFRRPLMFYARRLIGRAQGGEPQA